MVINSCNHTREELVKEFENFNQLKASTPKETQAPKETESYKNSCIFSYVDHIRTYYPTFIAGGSVGSRVATIAFMRS